MNILRDVHNLNTSEDFAMIQAAIDALNTSNGHTIIVDLGTYNENVKVYNTIYNNYFNNTNNAWDDGNNTWNIAKTAGTNSIGGSWLGGNYWSDYTGEDSVGDGLGDTQHPYDSSGDIQNGGDYLPLVKPSAP